MTHLQTPPADLVGTFLVPVEVTVRVTIRAEGAVTRATGPDGDEFRRGLFDLRTRDDVLAHLARVAVHTRHTDGRQIDGWADLPYGAVSMEVVDVDTPTTVYNEAGDSWHPDLTRR